MRGSAASTRTNQLNMSASDSTITSVQSIELDDHENHEKNWNYTE
jgi:hypothetical protein